MNAVVSCLDFRAWHHPDGTGFYGKVGSQLCSDPKMHYQWNPHFFYGDGLVSGGVLSPQARDWQLGHYSNWHHYIYPQLIDCGLLGHALLVTWDWTDQNGALLRAVHHCWRVGNGPGSGCNALTSPQGQVYPQGWAWGCCASSYDGNVHCL